MVSVEDLLVVLRWFALVHCEPAVPSPISYITFDFFTHMVDISNLVCRSGPPFLFHGKK